MNISLFRFKILKSFGIYGILGKVFLVLDWKGRINRGHYCWFQCITLELFRCIFLLVFRVVIKNKVQNTKYFTSCDNGLGHNSNFEYKYLQRIRSKTLTSPHQILPNWNDVFVDSVLLKDIRKKSFCSLNWLKTILKNAFRTFAFIGSQNCFSFSRYYWEKIIKTSSRIIAFCEVYFWDIIA